MTRRDLQENTYFVYSKFGNFQWNKWNRDNAVLTLLLKK
jgi:hypothetical protein